MLRGRPARSAPDAATGPSALARRSTIGSMGGMTDPTTAPAGWYDDGRGSLRYWNGTQWTEHTAPLARTADQTATAQYPATPASDHSATQPYGVTPSATGPTAEPSGPNVVGIVALVAAVVGFVFACIPFVQVVAWILLPVALVLAIVALFLEGRKWPAIAALVVSVLGAIVGAVVAAVVVFNVVGRFVDSGVIQEQIREGLEEEFGTPVPTESAPPAETRPGSVAGLEFGETMVWGDGVTMTVSEPETFTPSDFAVGVEQSENLVFSLTITNGSSENVQPVVVSMLSSGGTEATRIIDVGAEGGQVGIPPTTPIPPGESITWQEAWSVDDPGSLTMHTAPSFGYESVEFTNVP